VVEFSSPAAARLFLANSSVSGRVRLALAERGFSLRFTDPAAMLAWCDAAAVNIPLTLPGVEAARLLAHLGNAHRVNCNLGEAETYLRQAQAIAPADPMVLDFYAGLLKDKGQLETAAEFLRRAAGFRRVAKDRFLLARTLLQTSMVHSEAGFPERAVDNALSALDIIGLLPEGEERERLARAGFHNLAKALVDAGKPQEATWVVKHCKNGFRLGDEAFCLKTDWLMADIAGAFGEIDNAVKIYEEVRERFTALGKLREVALVTLDLARLLLKPRPLRAREEALSVWPILDGFGIARDAREAKLLADIVEHGSEAALVELAAALRSASLSRRSPGLPLPGPGRS
jgi:tetratricopeptide (TPR) repeat protein